MLLKENLSVDGTEEPNNPAKGSPSLKSAQEILSACDPISGGNTVPTDLICTQPLSAAAPLAEVSLGATGFKKPQCDVHKPSCPRCGLTISDNTVVPLSPSHQNSSKRNKSRSNGAGSHQLAATPGDSCFHLLLACLWCQCSMLLLGLLEACSSCLHTFCSSCCQACTRCCSAVQETPVEDLNCHAHCHSVLFDSCCETAEFLEFCVECCEICHRG